MLLYFKQAWHILKQNRFYSIIYILATGLSIAMVMVLAIVLYLKVANIYPETDRDRLLILHNAKAVTNDGDSGYSFLSLEAVRSCIYSLQTAEAVAAIYNVGGSNFVQPEDSPEQVPTVVKCVDTGFWKVFTFSFLAGSPFTEADLQSGIRTVVISESFARQLFGTTEVIGKYISLNFDSYRICGVVKDVSTITERTFAQLWMPYTAYPEFTPAWNAGRYENTLGAFTGYALAPSASEMNRVKDEILANLNRYKASLTGVEFSVYSQPDRQWESIIRSGGVDLDTARVLSLYGLIFLLLLLVPAISLSGMADSQMDRRLTEMGIRRA
ncbi:ABC transporter permease, partial [Parabacteroides sp. OttesenSCG-928-G21]|nr:ABC transporter permease [Parabacteroides sp. OttesenSCG-928-G21]